MDVNDQNNTKSPDLRPHPPIDKAVTTSSDEDTPTADPGAPKKKKAHRGMRGGAKKKYKRPRQPEQTNQSAKQGVDAVNELRQAHSLQTETGKRFDDGRMRVVSEKNVKLNKKLGKAKREGAQQNRKAPNVPKDADEVYYTAAEDIQSSPSDYETAQEKWPTKKKKKAHRGVRGGVKNNKTIEAAKQTKEIAQGSNQNVDRTDEDPYEDPYEGKLGLQMDGCDEQYDTARRHPAPHSSAQPASQVPPTARQRPPHHTSDTPSIQGPEAMAENTTTSQDRHTETQEPQWPGPLPAQYNDPATGCVKDLPKLSPLQQHYYLHHLRRHTAYLQHLLNTGRLGIESVQRRQRLGEPEVTLPGLAGTIYNLCTREELQEFLNLSQARIADSQQILNWNGRITETDMEIVRRHVEGDGRPPQPAPQRPEPGGDNMALPAKLGIVRSGGRWSSLVPPRQGDTDQKRPTHVQHKDDSARQGAGMGAMSSLPPITADFARAIRHREARRAFLGRGEVVQETATQRPPVPAARSSSPSIGSESDAGNEHAFSRDDIAIMKAYDELSEGKGSGSSVSDDEVDNVIYVGDGVMLEDEPQEYFMSGALNPPSPPFGSPQRPRIQHRSEIQPQVSQSQHAPAVQPSASPENVTAVRAWQRNFVDALQTSAEMPVPDNEVSNLSEDELRAAGALLMLGRPEARNEAELDEKQGGVPLWSRQTTSEGVEVMGRGVREGEENENEDV